MVRCSCRTTGQEGATGPCFVPPDPSIMALLFAEYLRARKGKKMTFQQYLVSIGYTDPSVNEDGMDDAIRFRGGPAGLERIAVPMQPVKGKLVVKVLLVDFSDRPGTLPKEHYEDLLFSKATYPTGSMRDYFKEVSLGKVDITGAVHGWLRMPNPYSFYTHGESGTRWQSYPHNAPRLAEDAVQVALQNGVAFGPELDKLRQGIVTALFIIHAGRGAEVMPPSLRGQEIWSHKWVMRNPVNVGTSLNTTIYLTVPHDCKLGVCAHELGHLAFQWQDFYDPNYDDDGKWWDGSGLWDLMAGGSYNGSGTSPAHPAGLHKVQHGWIKLSTVKKSRALTLRPYTAKSGRAYKIVSPAYSSKQYLLLENRSKRGFDFHVPGEGLLVWCVDEAGEQEAPDKPGLMLVQADGKHQLDDPRDWNQGDAGDPFPGTGKIDKLSDAGGISTTFPNCAKSGVVLTNIRHDPATGIIKLSVKVAAAALGPSGALRRAKAKRKAKGMGVGKRQSAAKSTVHAKRMVRRRAK